MQIEKPEYADFAVTARQYKTKERLIQYFDQPFFINF